MLAETFLCIDDDAFYLFLQKQKRAYGHIPILWVLSHTEKKRGTCDDAFTITLVAQWWFFVPLVAAEFYILCRVTTLSVHLYK